MNLHLTIFALIFSSRGVEPNLKSIFARCGHISQHCLETLGTSTANIVISASFVRNEIVGARICKSYLTFLIKDWPLLDS